jgi:hypothetical protein
MKSVISLAIGALLAGQALAHPVGLTKRGADIDTTVLQFALTVRLLDLALKALLTNSSA